MYSSQSNSECLAEFAGVSNSSTEDGSVFPQFFCNPCHSKLKRAKKASEDGVPFHSIVPVEWSPHVENCQVGLKYLRLTLIININYMNNNNIKKKNGH